MNTPSKANLSRIQMMTSDELPQQQRDKKKQKRIKRCHGNKKLQRFRKKCRAKGMKPITIAKQVKKRFNVIEDPIIQTTTSSNQLRNWSTTVSNKRKRDSTKNRVVRSTSEISIAESPPKKRAKRKSNLSTTTTTTTSTATATSMITDNNIYPCASYLRRLSPVLLQALRLKLDHPLKKRREQIFVFERLRLSDKRYCLELHQSLWQSCLTLSSEQHIWPVSKAFPLFGK